MMKQLCGKVLDTNEILALEDLKYHFHTEEVVNALCEISGIRLLHL